MKLELVKYKCASCGSTFDAPEIGSDSYGEFLLRSSSGSVTYLDAFQDKTYEDVDQLLAAYAKTGGLSAFDRAQVLRRVYGEIACDKDGDGNPFVLGAHPVCPVCGNQEMASWEFKEPLELVDVAIEPVTHNRWNSLSRDEKLRLVEQSLSD
jgi:hypothetical protein